MNVKKPAKTLARAMLELVRSSQRSGMEITFASDPALVIAPMLEPPDLEKMFGVHDGFKTRVLQSGLGSCCKHCVGQQEKGLSLAAGNAYHQDSVVCDCWRCEHEGELICSSCSRICEGCGERTCLNGMKPCKKCPNDAPLYCLKNCATVCVCGFNCFCMRDNRPATFLCREHPKVAECFLCPEIRPTICHECERKCQLCQRTVCWDHVRRCFIFGIGTVQLCDACLPKENKTCAACSEEISFDRECFPFVCPTCSGIICETECYLRHKHCITNANGKRPFASLSS